MTPDLHLTARQAARVPYPGPPERALAFLRDPLVSLARVPFIKNLRLDGSRVHADLSVNVPFLGSYLLDFESELEDAEAGADLHARPREGRAWAEVSGSGRLIDGPTLIYDLLVTVHLNVPSGGQWGARAFTRMAEATAAATLGRVTALFGPALIEAAREDAQGAPAQRLPGR